MSIFMKKHRIDNFFKKRTSKCRDGYALLVTMWVVFIFALLASTYFYQSFTSARLVQSQFDRSRAKNLAMMGIAQGVLDLKNDKIWARYEGDEEFDGIDDPRNYDAKNNVWFTEEEYHQKNYPFQEEEQGFFEVRVYPLNDRLDINTAHWELLETYFLQIGKSRETAEELTRAIIDWRTPGDTVIDKDEDKIEYYNEGEVDDPEYVPFNRDYKVMEELLEVKGVTPELFWGIDEDNQEIKRPLLFRPFDYYTADDERQIREKRGLLDVFTVYNSDNNNINVNFVSEFILKVMIDTETGDSPAAATAAEHLVDYREDRDQRDYENVVPYTRLRDLEFSGTNVPSEVEDQLTVRSDQFRIIARGTRGRVDYTVVADVERSWEEMQLVDNWDRKHDSKVGTGYFPVVRVINWTEK